MNVTWNWHQNSPQEQHSKPHTNIEINVFTCARTHMHRGVTICSLQHWQRNLQVGKYKPQLKHFPRWLISANLNKMKSKQTEQGKRFIKTDKRAKRKPKLVSRTKGQKQMNYEVQLKGQNRSSSSRFTYKKSK